MADLDKAIAAAREAEAAVDAAALKCDVNPQAWRLALAKFAERSRDLLAALDAARGQAVAWRAMNYRGEAITDWQEGTPPASVTEQDDVTVELAYAAPPAAADDCACDRYFAMYSCGANVGEGECDCPKCQGFCDCAAKGVGRE